MNGKNKGWCCFTQWVVWFMLGTSPAMADSVLTLEEAIALALKHDATYQQEQKTAQADAKVVDKAIALIYPAVTFNASISETDSDVDSVDSESQVMSLDVSQVLFNREAWVRYEQAEVRADIAQLQWQNADEAVLKRVVDAYVDAVEAQQKTQLSEAQVNASELRWEKVKTSLKLGSASRLDEAQAKASLDLMQAQHLGNQHQWLTTKTVLMQLVKQPVERVQSFVASGQALPSLTGRLADWQDLLKQSRSQQLQRLALDQAAIEIEAQRAAYYPQLNAQASLKRLSGESQGVDYDRQDVQWTIALSMPLFQGFATNASVEEAALDHQAAMAQYEAQQEALQHSLSSAYHRADQLQQQVIALQQAVLSSQSSLSATEEAYKLGSSDLIDVFNAQSSVIEARQNLVSAQSGWVKNWLSIHQLISGLNADRVGVVTKLLD